MPLLAVGLALGKPGLVSILSGLGVSLVGEGIRGWAVAHIGSVSRTRGDGIGPLVTGGPFARSRNPIYLGNLLVGAGMVWATDVPVLTAVYVLLFFAQYGLIVAWEESRLRAEHGERYERYRIRVPRWFPRPRRPACEEDSVETVAATLPLWQVLRSERSTLLGQVAIYAALGILAAFRA